MEREYSFFIIEDASHSIGAKYLDKSIGGYQYSSITVFSFHPVKIITTGEGGVAMTNNSLYAEKMELLRSHGVTRDPEKMHDNPDGDWYYEQIDLGFNYRMTDIQATLGSSQLDRIDQYVLRRTEIAKRYDAQLDSMDIEPLVQLSDRDSAHHLYVVMVRGGRHERNKIYNSLREKGIGVSLHYMPVYNQPYYKKKNDINKLVVAEDYFNKTISLPIFPGLSRNDFNYIVNQLSFLLNYNTPTI